MDLVKLFASDVPLLEIFIRGTVVYLALFLMLRLVLKRQSSNLSVTDLLVIVLIADAAQNAMSSDYKSITDGLLLVGTIVFWDFLLDWIGYRFPFIGRFIRPEALPLVKDGKILYKNMRKELITQEELLSQMRVSGCEKIDDVKCAYMEGDGRISIISYDQKGMGQDKAKNPI